ncbi:MAG: TonB-dependent receptor, partial [Longimicrobiales bacterium]
MGRLRLRALWVGVWVSLCVTPLSGQAPPDSVPADTTVYILEPLAVDVERERAAPPPVIAITVDADIVRQSQESDPYRVLRQTTGVEVHDQGQGPGFASNVIMRGFTSDHSSDVLLVIDGVPVNLPAHGHIEGYADWNVLMTRSVSSMRVIHGGASPLYGDFALGGVVEVFTRADAEGLEGSFGGTTFGDFKGDLVGGRRSEDGGFFLGSSFQKNRGWRDNSDYWLANGLARGWAKVGEGRLEGGVSLYGTGWDSPGFVSVPRFNQPALEGAVDPSDGGDSKRFVAHGRYSVPLGDASYLQATLWGMGSDYSIYLNIPDHNHGEVVEGVQVQSGEWDERLGTGGQVEVAFPQAAGDFVLGASGRADWVGYRHAATFERTVLTPEIDLDARHTAGALYGRWRHTLAGVLGLDVGARLDVLNHRSRSNLLAVEPAWESATNAVFSPKFGARYLMDARWSLRASSARGFR